MAVLEWMLHNIPSVIAVLIAFGFIITIHELGHFIMARRVGIRCPEFAIGFGPQLYSFWFRGTRFSLCLFPVGGYVLMLGEDPDSDEQQNEYDMVANYLPEGILPAHPAAIAEALENSDFYQESPRPQKKEESASENAQAVDKNADETSAVVDVKDEESQPEAAVPQRTPQQQADAKRSVVEHIRFLPDRLYETCRELEGNFNDKKVPDRLAVIIGGVTMNFISALLLFWVIGLFYGIVDMSPNSLAQVMKVYDNSPAAAAGLEYGDKIDSIDGQKVVSGSDMVRLIAKYPGQKVNLGVTRGNKQITLAITPSLYAAGLAFEADAKHNGAPAVSQVNPYGDNTPEVNLHSGDIITAFNDKPVKSLAELAQAFQAVADAGALDSVDKPGAEPEAALDKKVGISLSVAGRADKVQIMLPVYEFAPAGKMGIMPAQVTEFKFIDTTTNEVQAVTAGSIADKAGIAPKDLLYYVNGARIFDDKSLDEVLTNLQTSQEPIVIDIARNGEHVQVTITDKPVSAQELGTTLQPVTFGLVVGHSFKLIGRLIIAPFIIVEQIATKVLSPDLVKASMSGPLGIMQLIFELSNDGVGKFLYIVALINAAVGAFNVIPFPALDGARALVLVIGWIRGRELDARKEAMVHQIGLYLIFALVILVTIIDIQRLFAGVPLTQ